MAELVAKDVAEMLSSTEMSLKTALDEAHLESAVGTCLSRLEEVSAVMESVRQEVSGMEEDLPALQQQLEKVHAIFAYVDRMEGFVSTVSSTVDRLDAAVASVEKEKSIATKGMRKMKSLFGRKDPEKQDQTPKLPDLTGIPHDTKQLIRQLQQPQQQQQQQQQRQQQTQ